MRNSKADVSSVSNAGPNATTTVTIRSTRAWLVISHPIGNLGVWVGSVGGWVLPLMEH